MQPTYKPGIFSAAQEQPASMLPELDKISTLTNVKARRICERVGFEITGYVFTHRSRPDKCILDMQAVRWITAADLTRVMQWKKPIERATIPEGFEPPPEPVTDGERELADLAMALGIGYSAAIPHNTGWFVPCNQSAFTTAREAIMAHFEHVYAGGEVYRPGKPPREAMTPSLITGNLIMTGEVTIAAKPPKPTKAASKTAPEPAQIGLF